MSLRDRAAQFAPFAALNGYEDAITETARNTSDYPELSVWQMQELSRKLAYAMSFADPPEIDITYFVPDKLKSGGAYVTLRAAIKKVDACLNTLTFTDKTQIALTAVCDINGEIFSEIDLWVL